MCDLSSLILFVSLKFLRIPEFWQKKHICSDVLQLVDKGIDKLTSGCRKGCRSRELSVVGVQRYDRGTIRG